jgi:hypothetical protein
VRRRPRFVQPADRANASTTAAMSSAQCPASAASWNMRCRASISRGFVPNRTHCLRDELGVLDRAVEGERRIEVLGGHHLSLELRAAREPSRRQPNQCRTASSRRHAPRTRRCRRPPRRRRRHLPAGGPAPRFDSTPAPPGRPAAGCEPCPRPSARYPGRSPSYLCDLPTLDGTDIVGTGYLRTPFRNRGASTMVRRARQPGPARIASRCAWRCARHRDRRRR